MKKDAALAIKNKHKNAKHNAIKHKHGKHFREK